MKKCTKCGLDKDESEFGKHQRNRDGLRHECKTCAAVCRKARYNSATAKKQQEAWRSSHPDKYRETQIKQRLRKYTSPEAKAMHMVRHSRDRAKEKGVPHTIVYQDLLPIPLICPVLGLPMPLSGPATDENMASLDKIIPERGYVKGNVCVVSRRANSLKRNATIEELELVLAYMKRHAAEQQQDQQEQGSEPRNT